MRLRRRRCWSTRRRWFRCACFRCRFRRRRKLRATILPCTVWRPAVGRRRARARSHFRHRRLRLTRFRVWDVPIEVVVVHVDVVSSARGGLKCCPVQVERRRTSGQEVGHRTSHTGSNASSGCSRCPTRETGNVLGGIGCSLGRRSACAPQAGGHLEQGSALDRV